MLKAVGEYGVVTTILADEHKRYYTKCREHQLHLGRIQAAGQPRQAQAERYSGQTTVF